MEKLEQKEKIQYTLHYSICGMPISRDHKICIKKISLHYVSNTTTKLLIPKKNNKKCH